MEHAAIERQFGIEIVEDGSASSQFIHRQQAEILHIRRIGYQVDASPARFHVYGSPCVLRVRDSSGARSGTD